MTELEEKLYTYLDELLDYVLYVRMVTRYRGSNEPNLQKMIQVVGDIKYRNRREKANENEHRGCDRKD